MFDWDELSTDFCYSLFSGSSIYRYCGILENAHFRTLIDNGKYVPEVVSVDHGFYYWIKRIRYIENSFTHYDIGVYRHYGYIIKNRPSFSRILWPVDLIEISCPIKEIEGKAMTISRHHDAIDDSNKVDVSEFALLFPYSDCYKQFQTTAKDIVDHYKEALITELDENRLTYKNPVIRKLAIEIIKSLKELYSSGYLYNDFSFPRYSIDNTGRQSQIFLDFSNLVYRIDENDRVVDFMIEEPKEMEADFADPYFMNHEEIIVADEHSFHFSVCSMLFYLFFGRNAYMGSTRMASDVTLLQHYINARERLKTPYFIFDEDEVNNVNKLGLLKTDQSIIDLFDNAPSRLKEYFVKTLSYKNATRSNQNVYAPTLDDWLSAFDELRWIEESENVKLEISEIR